MDEIKEPVTEIVIRVGERKDVTDLSKIEVSINGEKIKNLRGFKFVSHVNEPPVITVERYPY